MAATIAAVNSESTLPSDDSTLFKNVAFWFSARVPMRSVFMLQVQSHGGKVVSIEKHADILIADHARRDNPPSSYSYRWIEQSISENYLVDKEPYLCSPVDKPIRAVGSSQPTKGGRNPFTAQDDVILYQWVENKTRSGEKALGNKIYIELEKQNNRHTSQSWRDRYVKYLIHRPPKLLPSQSQSQPPEPPEPQRSPEPRKDSLPSNPPEPAKAPELPKTPGLPKPPEPSGALEPSKAPGPSRTPKPPKTPEPPQTPEPSRALIAPKTSKASEPPKLPATATRENTAKNKASKQGAADNSPKPSVQAQPVNSTNPRGKESTQPLQPNFRLGQEEYDALGTRSTFRIPIGNYKEAETPTSTVRSNTKSSGSALNQDRNSSHPLSKVTRTPTPTTREEQNSTAKDHEPIKRSSVPRVQQVVSASPSRMLDGAVERAAERAADQPSPPVPTFYTPTLPMINSRRTVSAQSYSGRSSPFGFRQGQRLSLDNVSNPVAYSSPFTEEDKSFLLSAALSIQNLAVGIYDKAWEDFAQENPEHSSFEWRHFYENIVLPEHKSVQSIPSKRLSLQSRRSSGTMLPGNMETPSMMTNEIRTQNLSESRIASSPNTSSHVPNLNPEKRTVELPNSTRQGAETDPIDRAPRPPDINASVNAVRTWASSGLAIEPGSPNDYAKLTDSHRKRPRAVSQDQLDHGSAIHEARVKRQLLNSTSSQDRSTLPLQIQEQEPTITIQDDDPVDGDQATVHTDQLQQTPGARVSTPFGIHESNALPDEEKENLIRNKSGSLMFTSPRRHLQTDQVLEAFTDPPKDFRLIAHEGDERALSLDQSLRDSDPAELVDDVLHSIEAQNRTSTPKIRSAVEERPESQDMFSTPPERRNQSQWTPSGLARPTEFENVRASGQTSKPASPTGPSTPPPTDENRYQNDDIQDILDALTPTPDLDVPPPPLDIDSDEAVDTRSPSVRRKTQLQSSAIPYDKGIEKDNIDRRDMYQDAEHDEFGRIGRPILNGSRKIERDRQEGLRASSPRNKLGSSLVSNPLERASQDSDGGRSSSQRFQRDESHDQPKTQKPEEKPRIVNNRELRNHKLTEIKDFITEQVKQGWKESDAIWSLQRTGWDIDLATQVLVSMGKGYGLPEAAGIWSLEDDQLLLKGTTKDFKLLRLRHTSEGVDKRRDFLSEFSKQNKSHNDSSSLVPHSDISSNHSSQRSQSPIL